MHARAIFTFSEIKFGFCGGGEEKSGALEANSWRGKGGFSDTVITCTRESGSRARSQSKSKEITITITLSPFPESRYKRSSVPPAQCFRGNPAGNGLIRMQEKDIRAPAGDRHGEGTPGLRNMRHGSLRLESPERREKLSGLALGRFSKSPPSIVHGERGFHERCIKNALNNRLQARSVSFLRYR